MILLEISDIKNAMAHLLARNSFDSFYMERAEIMTFAAMSLSGRRNIVWYDSDETDDGNPLSDWVRWEEIKPVVFSYIKGNRTPSSMKISLKADADMSEKILTESGGYRKYQEQQPGLLLHFRYEQDRLHVVTGISYPQFTMDKQMEFTWDEAVCQYFKQLGIALL